MAKQVHRKRVLVVGAGSAGTACAWSLARHPDRFDVHVWEALPVPGGVASSCTIKEGHVVLNDQVQGGAPSYRHNLMLLEQHGFKPQPVQMRIAFGCGAKQWTNFAPSELTQRLQPEIKRFGRVLRWVARFEPLFVFVPIERLLRLWGFSNEFRHQMVFPLVALFFGTGNQTPQVASAVIARVFLDPDLRLFDYCPHRLLNSVPDMFAFPVLQHVFTTIAARSPYQLHCGRRLMRVERGPQGVTATDAQGVKEVFSDLVFACDAETVLRVLAHPTWLERRLLGNVTYFTDYCVTHEDKDYMTQMYDMKEEQRANYFVRTYPSAPHKIEMSFNLSTYQPHLKTAGLDVYQTYYLNVSDQPLWSDSQVAPAKVLARRWMRQFAHTWQHFASWVPWGRLIQGTQHTWYAGAYTLFNTQEIAVMSGLAAAERLGADYPFAHDPLAAAQFDMFMSIVHGTTRRNKHDKATAVQCAAAHKAAVAAAAATTASQPEGAAASLEGGAMPMAEVQPLAPAEVTTAVEVPGTWGVPPHVLAATTGRSDTIATPNSPLVKADANSAGTAGVERLTQPPGEEVKGLRAGLAPAAPGLAASADLCVVVKALGTAGAHEPQGVEATRTDIASKGLAVASVADGQATRR